MTIEEAQKHFTKLAEEAGLGKEETQAVLKVMENEKFRGGVSSGYKRHEDYSREMDALRTEKQRLATWYQNEELPKFQQYQAGLEKLKRYEETYGEISDDGLNNGRGGVGDRNGNRKGDMSGSWSVSKEELDRLVEEKLKQRDGAYVGLTKTAVRISSDYMRRFKDTLDVDAVEKLALDKGLPLDQAYKEYIAPKEQAALEARHKEDIEKAKAEAIRDYQSRLKLPIDTKPKEAHPFFDRKSPVEGKTELDQDRNSKDAFMQGWNNYAEENQPKP